MNSFTPVTRTRTRRQMNGNASEWLSAVEGLPAVHARLRRVVIEEMPALDRMALLCGLTISQPLVCVVVTSLRLFFHPA
jgi:hypothetical protein